MAQIDRARFKNPHRSEPGFTDMELEVTRLAEEGTPQTVIEYTPVVREYWAPFNYPNFCVELGRTDPYVGAEFNEDGVELDIPPYGAITFTEEEPIVEVCVIGSACVPPGYILLQAEPVEYKFPRSGVKMKASDLWGQHQRIEPFKLGIDEGWHNSGLSSAHFALPPCTKVTLMAGSQTDICQLDVENMRHDAHYCVRAIRVTVRK